MVENNAFTRKTSIVRFYILVLAKTLELSQGKIFLFREIFQFAIITVVVILFRLPW